MRCAVRTLCVLGCLFFWAGSLNRCAEAQEPTGTQHYVVQYGDTLWDIAGAYLGSPYRWRDIHQQNPFITDPNLIYPGDILGISGSMLPGEGQLVALEGGQGKRSDKPIARPWYGVPAPEPTELASPTYPYPVVPSTELIEAIGYIIPYSLEDLEAADFGQITDAGGVDAETASGTTTARIIDSETGRPGLLFGDILYINKGFEDDVHEGDLYVAFRPFREIRHPLTDELIGTQIDILGRIRVKTLEAGISSAEITKSYNYIEHGDPILPVSEVSLPLQKPILGNAQSYGFKVGNQLIAHVIAEQVGQNIMSDGDIVFIDVGAAQGVQPADNFIIFREVGDGYPKQSIGRMTVLSVQEQTSAALITYSVKAIELGEQAVLMR